MRCCGRCCGRLCWYSRSIRIRSRRVKPCSRSHILCRRSDRIIRVKIRLSLVRDLIGCLYTLKSTLSRLFGWGWDTYLGGRELCRCRWCGCTGWHTHSRGRARGVLGRGLIGVIGRDERSASSCEARDTSAIRVARVVRCRCVGRWYTEVVGCCVADDLRGWDCHILGS